MMMLLSILCAGAFVLALFFATLGPDGMGETADAELELPIQPGRFFATDAPGRPTADQLALGVLLAQIERHVRLEQVAAERFVDLPSPDALGSHSTPLAVN